MCARCSILFLLPIVTGHSFCRTIGPPSTFINKCKTEQARIEWDSSYENQNLNTTERRRGGGRGRGRGRIGYLDGGEAKEMCGYGKFLPSQ